MTEPDEPADDGSDDDPGDVEPDAGQRRHGHGAEQRHYPFGPEP
jgi:hypothetical protein